MQELNYRSLKVPFSFSAIVAIVPSRLRGVRAFHVLFEYLLRAFYLRLVRLPYVRYSHLAIVPSLFRYHISAITTP